ncbi:glycosyltransferase [Plesiomonas shigelloides]|uniref:glycosyltransferase family 2 protein n=1 Tax=Plesiomonas shigelloides TaxID=703 RepID=UPI0012629B4E|nr:glycosyltransferase family 2 protein [Plesiomonas shigelloides]KAB7692144.1 glycosyltransferase [Plesiomonas shigelloides]
MRSTISAVILSKNEESVIADCLKSLDWVDEIILLDSGSQDSTIEIANTYNAKVYYNLEWQGFGKQRQLAQSYASSDYILMIDSDERISENLKNSIIEILTQENASRNLVYSCNRRNLFIDKYLSHGGWYPDKVIRIYHKSITYNDNLVHESLNYGDRSVINLHGDILHLTCRDLSTFTKKQIAYAEDWANERFIVGKKTSLLSAFTHAIFSFFKSYIIRAGFLDGAHGLVLSVSIFNYTLSKYLFLWAKCKSKQS